MKSQLRRTPLRRTPHAKGLALTAGDAADTEELPARTTVRLKEIVPLYQDVTIGCVVSRYLADAAAIGCAEDVVQLFGFLEFESRESFYAVHLNAKNQILCLDQVSLGSLSASIVHPREVFKSALVSSASALVFVHNHPSGDPTPSREDHQIHDRLEKAGELLGIRILDHLIIGDKGRFVSLASRLTATRGSTVQDAQSEPLFV